MGGPGSGRPKTSSNTGGGGRYTIEGEVTMTVVDAIAPMQELKTEVDGVSRSVKKLDNDMDSVEWVKMHTGAEIAAEKQKNLELANINTMVTLQSLTAASNQLTGATYKMIAGLEATGKISTERAADLQNTARQAELLTGAFEFLLAIEILLNVAGMSMLPVLTGITAGMTGVAAATWAAVAPLLIFTGYVLLVVGVVAIMIGILYLVHKHWNEIANVIGVVNAGFQQMLDIVLSATGAITGLTSALGSIGDAFTDNPVTKGLAKAGGAIF